jgi:hypothetical protein
MIYFLDINSKVDKHVINTVSLFLCSYFHFFRYLTDQILNPHFLVAFVPAVLDSPSPQREIRYLLFTEHQEKLSSMISRWFTKPKRVLKIVCTYTCLSYTTMMNKKSWLWKKKHLNYVVCHKVSKLFCCMVWGIFTAHALGERCSHSSQCVANNASCINNRCSCHRDYYLLDTVTCLES